MTDTDFQLFFGNESRWLNPASCTEDQSTVSRFFTYYDETVGESRSAYALVAHVRGFPRGKGFVGQVRSKAGGYGQNSKVFYGTGDDAWQSARDAAIAGMDKFQKELDAL